MEVKYIQEIYIEETEDTKIIIKELYQDHIPNNLKLFVDPLYIHMNNKKLEYKVIRITKKTENKLEIEIEKLLISTKSDFESLIENIKKFGWEFEESKT